MRDCNIIPNNGLEEELPDNGYKCIYKEVVIIGNGPSGITLSYLLSGHSPYYNRIPHPDPMLSARLIECSQKSLLHQDLAFLSQGIEGRSRNPVSLLIDSMTHPGADSGLEWPSLLTWKKSRKCMDHIVLGKGLPGGTWQGITDQVLTISPGRWMALPGLEFKEYKFQRAPASAVASYYLEYIKKHDLSSKMAPNTTVTLIQPLVSMPKRRARWRVWVNNGNGGTVNYECRHLILATGSSDKAGCLGVPGESFSFISHDLRGLEERLSLVEKISSLDTPKRYEDAKMSSSLDNIGNFKAKENVLRSTDNISRPVRNSSFCETDLKRLRDGYDLETKRGAKRLGSAAPPKNVFQSDVKSVENLNKVDDNFWTSLGEKDKVRHQSLGELSEGEQDLKRLPVLVVGAGLSAADAILTARRRNFPVVHAFRRTPAPAQLPPVMYPEYNEVYQLMQGMTESPDYRSLPGYQVTEFFDDTTVRLTNSSGSPKTLKISAAAILIGSQPDLSFLPKKLRNLGIDVNKPVDCKVNPVHIDPFSYKCLRAHPGLYALGPLVGDNFVRFLQGGAVAIASHILKENNLQNTT
ncbi:UNVERIFIED_CONTAM: hypothetical protein PYX00_002799 [Menopon gallinae]|uniref:Uncharacterized protein n=1 Tax=Menopon gallinae TaxID=328185 RepID=A0AAW2HZ89_9NEOP